MQQISVLTTLAAAGTDFSLLTTIAAGFAAAWVFGLITHRLGLSPIVGYLLGGVAIGKHTPGFRGDEGLAQQLAEIGVILLMFGVGLHFHLKDLLAVKRVAIPGAVVQSAVAVIATVTIFHFFGWELKPSLVLGMAMAVASTVVLLRVLMDQGMLSTSHGHVAVGWLIVEDIFTVLALVMVPLLGTVTATTETGEVVAQEAAPMLVTVGWAVFKLCALVAIVLLAGSRVVPWILTKVARLRSPELFTLTVLVLSISIAVGSASLFGASVALGAFLAGMVVGQSALSHQAAADALPMRDAFAVLFFVSVGMLFDPGFLVEHPLLVVAGLGIVLIGKPLAAIGIVAILGYPARTALTVALGLAQIGEFSFILAQVASKHSLMPPEGLQLLVATAMISITVNPLLFRSLGPIESAMKKVPWLWRLMNARAEAAANAFNSEARAKAEASAKPVAVIVGYGPVGRVVDALLRDAGFENVIVDMNIDTVRQLAKSGRLAIYGDASRREVLDQAGLGKAEQFVITLPKLEGRAALVIAAKEINPKVRVTIRARYLAEHDTLRHAGADRVVYEEGEAGVALARSVLESRGVDAPTMDRMLGAIRKIWRMDD